MSFGAIQALICFAAAVAMASHVMLRPHKTTLHWTWLGVLSGMALWNVGGIIRHLGPVSMLSSAVETSLNGALFTSTFWFLAAQAQARERSAGLHRSLVALVSCASGMLALGVLTNDAHGLYFRSDAGVEDLQMGPRGYAEPMFWVLLAWSYLCVAAAIAIYLRAAGSLGRRASRQRGLVLVGASVVPGLMSTAYIFQVLPVSHDLTPTGLIASVVMVSLAVSRFHLLDSLPVARRSVVQNLEDAVVMASADGRITDWNPAAEEIMGEEALRSGIPLDEQLLSLKTGDKHGRSIDVTAATVSAQNGSATGHFAILADRTDADRLERLARQSQRLEIVGALAAGFAHEINDPLTYVHANLVEIERLGARVEAEDAGPDAELASELADLRAIARETLEGLTRIHRIAEDMRGLSRSGREEGEMLDLAEVARTALRISRLERSEEGPRVELRLEAVPPVLGHEDRLVQLVLNLLVNARQALSGTPDACITVQTCRAGRDVELVVTDNGPGIPETQRDRIFDPFFTTRAPDSGTGLGLAIAFDIAREHDGSLEERSKPGSGACFALRVPSGIGKGSGGSGGSNATGGALR